MQQSKSRFWKGSDGTLELASALIPLGWSELVLSLGFCEKKSLILSDFLSQENWQKKDCFRLVVGPMFIIFFQALRPQNQVFISLEFRISGSTFISCLKLEFRSLKWKVSFRQKLSNLKNFNSWMIKLTKTQTLPNCQGSNGPLCINLGQKCLLWVPVYDVKYQNECFNIWLLWYEDLVI
jgi:hypothetical protein